MFSDLEITIAHLIHNSIYDMLLRLTAKLMDEGDKAQQFKDDIQKYAWCSEIHSKLEYFRSQNSAVIRVIAGMSVSLITALEEKKLNGVHIDQLRNGPDVNGQRLKDLRRASFSEMSTYLLHDATTLAGVDELIRKGGPTEELVAQFVTVRDDVCLRFVAMNEQLFGAINMLKGSGNPNAQAIVNYLAAGVHLGKDVDELTSQMREMNVQ